MAALWDSGKAGAQTHVLVIAVGGFLPRDRGSEAQHFREYAAIARTGQSMLRWAFGAAEQFQPHLGAVFAAISDPREGEAEVSVNTPDGRKRAVYPTLANLRPLVRTFLKKLDEDPGNTGLVYLCGHGIAKNAGYMLTADWGTDPDDELHGLIDVDGFALVMQTKLQIGPGPMDIGRREVGIDGDRLGEIGKRAVILRRPNSVIERKSVYEQQRRVFAIACFVNKDFCAVGT